VRPNAHEDTGRAIAHVSRCSANRAQNHASLCPRRATSLSVTDALQAIAWYENLGSLALRDEASNGDFTLSLEYGQPSAPYYMFHSFSFLNGTSPGTGVLFGLHISIVEIGIQITAGSLGNPGFGGTLDPSGGFSMTLPGPAVVFLSGQTWYSLGIQLNPTTAGLYDPTAITSITFQ